MRQTITITRKWQVQIPKAIRQQIKLDKPMMAEVSAKNGSIIITPKRGSILELAGSLSKYAKNKKIDVNRIRDYIDYSKV